MVRRAIPTLDADCMGCASFDALTPDRVAAYAALFLIVEFNPRDNADPLERLVRSRDKAPRLPILVFARGGDERNAARTIKLGADDYWPIHAVKLGELGGALQRLVDPARGTKPADTPAVDPWRQPQIAGYRLIKTIAQSAAAAVYLARNDDLAQPVALKVQALKGRFEVSDADRQRFVRECEILSSLNHRSIADVMDFGITENYLYLALEYFPCGSLRDRLRNPVSEADAVNYARQIGEALQVLHAAHVVHRDLKPSNLMLTDDNRVILIDFGSASARLAGSELSRSDLCTGTLLRMRPEQIDNRDPDGRGDLYSLGVVLFEMLVGAMPFSRHGFERNFRRPSVGPGSRAFRSACSLPADHRSPCWQRIPADRYLSSGPVFEDLSAVSAPIRNNIGRSPKQWSD